MGITAHWIESNSMSGKWTLHSEVVAFQAIYGPHSGTNLGRYFISSMEHFGMLTPNSTNLLCITANNASNNHVMCDSIEFILSHRDIYSFDSNTDHLPCLAHVLNLAITDIMSVITNTATVETTSAIWEFDPTLPGNRVLGDSLDIISALCTLAIKIQASGQHISYFNHLQKECGIVNPLTIPLHSNVRWGTADRMLERSYTLRQPINLFINSADELFGPITTVRRPGMPVKCIPWTAFAFLSSDWDWIKDLHAIISDANNLQQIFSFDTQPTLWQAIPAYEELLSTWEVKLTMSVFEQYSEALQRGMEKIRKYYTKFDEKPAYILALGM